MPTPLQLLVSIEDSDARYSAAIKAAPDTWETKDGVIRETIPAMQRRLESEFYAALPTLVDAATSTAVTAAGIAQGAAQASGPVNGFYPTRALFNVALPGLAAGIYQIDRDESAGGNRTRYTVNGAHAATFQIFVERPWGPGIKYSAQVAALIGGYPANITLDKSDGSGDWKNTVAGNVTNPDAGGAGWIDFVWPSKTETMAAVRALPAPFAGAAGRPTQIKTAGYWSPEDGGDAEYYWRYNSTDADDGGSTIRPSSIAADAPGRWKLIKRLLPNPRAWGAYGNGIGNDLPVFQAMAASAAVTDISVPEGDYRFADGQFLDFSYSGKRLTGANREKCRILFNHSYAILHRAGRTAPTTDFVTNNHISGLGFKITGTAYGRAIQSYNIRDCSVNDIKTEGCLGWRIQHAIQANGAYDTNTGSSTVDPAVVAGLSPTNTDDLNQNLSFTNSVINFGVYSAGPGALRFEFVKGMTIHNVTGIGCNISWWGGGAEPGAGGENQFLRRVLDIAISDCHISRSNGGIYGNNGDRVKIINSDVSNIVDVGIDFEGCFNSQAIGCTSTDAGNANFSIFYAAPEVKFSDCIGIQTGAAASDTWGYTTSTQYTSSTSVLTVADNGAGLYRITVSAREWRNNQKIKIGTTVYPLTRIDAAATTYDLQGSVFGDGKVAVGSTIRYQQGSGAIWVRTGGFSTTGARGVDPIFINPTLKYTGPEGLGETSPGNQGTVIVQGGKFINVRPRFVPVGGANQGGSQDVTKMVVQIMQPSILASTLVTAGGPSDQGKFVRIGDITLIVTAAQPAGSVGIYAPCSVNAATMRIEGNVVKNTSGTALDTDIRFGSETIVTGGAATSVIEIYNNQADSFDDRSAVARAKVRWSGNTNSNSDPMPAIGTAAAPVPPTKGGFANGTKLEWTTHVAGGSEGLIAIGSGDARPPSDAWAVSTAYAFNEIKYVANRIYLCTTPGTSAATGTGPTGTGTNIADGTVRWQYKGPRTIFYPYGSISAVAA